MFSLGDLIVTYTPKNHTTIISYDFCGYDTQEVSVKEITNGERRLLKPGLIGIILKETGMYSTKWFMVYFSDLQFSSWISPIYLRKYI
jgi:hypothetical protein